MISQQLFLACVLLVSSAMCMKRYYFISAEERWWDYAPSKQNLVTNDTSISSELINSKEDRIGSVYRKAVLKQYTDHTFRTEIPPEPWRGYVGPTMKGETGDVLYVHFRNLASRPYGLHPHGIAYDKNSEGALYADGTYGRDKLDDTVHPGQNYRYKWSMKKSFTPTKDDDNCIPQGYHPHIRSHKDIDTGLIGMLIVCKPGTLNPDGSRKDVDKEFVMFTDIINETNSWLIEKGLERCLNPSKCRQLFHEKNGNFVRDTLMYQINGYIYGNLPDFPVHEGDRVVFYTMGLNLGYHDMGFQGQSLVVKHKRVNAYPVGNAVFEGLNLVARNPGRWLVYCRLTYHFKHGMAAFLNVRPSLSRKHSTKHLYGRTRRHFIAAEEILWDYRPSNKVLARVGKASKERSRTEEQFFTSNAAVGGKFVKAIFKEYTDGTFKIPKPLKHENRHMGIMGPAIKVEVGDTLEIIFKNKASRQYSFNPFGLDVTKENEGALYRNNRHSEKMTGAMTMPGQIRKYHFTVPKDVGPTPTDPQCITSSYQSFGDYARDMYSGLCGPLLICKPGTLDYNGKQRGIDKEFFLMFMRWYEQDGWYMDKSVKIAKMHGKKVDTKSRQFRESNAMRAINGRMFGNIDGFDMCIGDKVSWHVIGFGERFDLNAYVFEGNNVHYDGRQVNYVYVLPGRGETAYMKPDNPGSWLLYTGQLGFQMEGMVTKYNVHSCNGYLTPSIYKKKYRPVRRMYIAAVDIDWDFVPRKLNTVTMTDLKDPKTPGNLYVRHDREFIGSTYKKAVYREFTDKTFTTIVKRTRKDYHLGVLGPFIKAAVGDQIEIVYKNMASFENSISLSNLLEDNLMINTQREGVKPGNVARYKWIVPKRSGPGPNEPNCVGYSYTSPVFPKRDLATGLLGPLVICRKGILDKHGNRTDNVDEEFATAFVIFNEGDSHYFYDNLQKYVPNKQNPQNSLFREATQRYSINGFSFQNIPSLDMKVGDHVAWYTYSFGSFLDAHSSHTHGQTFLLRTSKTFRNDVVGVVPGTYETLEMLGTEPGIWMFHCHVGIHVSGGMFGVYTVFPNSTSSHENHSY